MDNHAGKAGKSDFDLGWLVCAIESEGSISLAWGNHWHALKIGRKRHPQIIPRVTLTNTDPLYIEKAVDISHFYGIGCNVERKKSQTSNTLRGIVWLGMKRVKALLEIIEPHLLGKRERAKLVLEFCNRRLAYGTVRTPYSQEELELFFTVRALNGKGRIPEKVFRDAFAGNPNDHTLGPFVFQTKGEDMV